jgi:hypothetical protein
MWLKNVRQDVRCISDSRVATYTCCILMSLSVATVQEIQVWSCKINLITLSSAWNKLILHKITSRSCQPQWLVQDLLGKVTTSYCLDEIYKRLSHCIMELILGNHWSRGDDASRWEAHVAWVNVCLIIIIIMKCTFYSLLTWSNKRSLTDFI